MRTDKGERGLAELFDQEFALVGCQWVIKHDGAWVGTFLVSILR
jgi:hypothetical protein